MKALFICNQNQHRSKTAELIFKDKFETKSAGLYGGKILSKEDIKWADILFVMDEEQRNELIRRFPKETFTKRLITLNISDSYSYIQNELINILENNLEELTEPFLK